MSDRRRTPGNQTSLREANRSRLVDAIKRYGSLTQVELAGITGLSPATVSNIVKELSASGVVHTTPSTHSGRRAQRVSLAHGLGLVCGVHVAQRQLRVALADMASTVVAEHHMPLARDHRADNELDKAALMIADMLEEVDATLDQVAGIGIAISAPIDLRTGTIVRRGIMRGWDGVPIAATMQRRLRRPVHVDNAANLAALAEAGSGAARGRSDVIVLDIGEGIGAGILIGGRVLRGHRGAAGEFGHVVVMPGGPLCRCGNRGCLEAVAGAQAVLDGLGDAGPSKLTDVIVKAMAGDPLYVRAVADAGRTIGQAAAGLANLLDPERIVVGGDFARAGELLLGPMRHAIESSLLVDSDDLPDLVTSQLDQSAALLGAIALAVSHVQLTDALSSTDRPHHDLAFTT